MVDFRQNFLKYFLLEKKWGFKNLAIIGGLENIIDPWKTESAQNGIPIQIINSVSDLLYSYRNLEIIQRQKVIDQLIDLVSLQNNTKIQSNIQKPERSGSSIIQNNTKPSENQIQKGLNAPLTVIYGIGPETAKKLKKLSLYTLNDLLHFYPRRYDDYSQLKTINHINFGDELTILASIKSINSRSIRGGKSQIIEAIVNDGTGSLRATWFNQPWIIKSLSKGKQIALSGKVDMYLGRFVLTNPEFEFIDKELLHTNGIVPIYSLTSGITKKWLRRIMFQVISFWAPRLDDYMPSWIKENQELIDLSTAIKQIHFPDNQQLLDSARYRLSFDEIFFLQIGVLSQKRNWENIKAEEFIIGDEVLNRQIDSLSFQLTKSQTKALLEIRKDLASGRQMNRLLQGDVGSGKTVIARFATEIICRGEAQVALMAPTSILAEQHYRTFSQMLTNSVGIKPVIKPDEIALLIGDTPESEKDKIRAGLSSGKIKVIIGTHSLIEDYVIFKKLQLVIIDEQHRFGVTQRSVLRLKGNNPHILVMSATPIPRSLALTIYGDLDISIIDEMPLGRIPVETHLLHPLEREKAYQIIRSQIEKGHQAFIIYPLIESENEEVRRAAVNEFERIRFQVFPNYKIGLIHGRLKQNEKDEIMSKFRNKDFNILVATSVIEVGLDIPNATVVLIEGANLFGLAQLHQIRGRVGRGNDLSYCLLIPDIEDNLENERLSMMVETNDGFKLAEFDLKHRGPGEFLGTRQSGYLGLKLASFTNLDLIEKARKQAISLFNRDPGLSEKIHADLHAEIQRFWPKDNNTIS